MTAERLKRAILDRRCLTAWYRGTERRFALHALGLKADGTPAAFAFQYGGGTTTNLPARGEWRCFDLDQLADIQQNGDRWRTPPNYNLARQTCLAEILLSIPER
ncbi:hypothetical protein SAMN02745126_00396 [Enhydrobacter aerosaccus]|uniref:WYL domain-containing protein n=1 Tax=Enhydrobacter aerosaccus TaxID=225324 RepID=A0A1T4JRV4_9HYPH|nr:hypothetical protein [Enhydrobacter aerosaccus]SJZ32898.1 hypothetical protein SAMN02745126_00396 [Enhydrobacter aerosaccus]